MVQITETQMRVLVFIANYADTHGYQPSYREIANAMGWSSLGYIAYTIRRLKKKGIILKSGPRSVAFAWRQYVTHEEPADVSGQVSEG